MNGGSSQWKDTLPHRGDALLLDELVRSEDEAIVFTASVDAGSAYAGDGEVCSIVAVDMAAQAAAVLEWQRSDLEKTGGYLVSVQSARVGTPHFKAGEGVVVRVDRVASKPPLFSYRGRADCNGKQLLQVEFSVMAT